MKHIIALLALVVAIGAPAAEDEAQSQARSAAITWLALTDNGKYSESWDNAATLFQASISRPEWEKLIKEVRAPLGANKSRSVKSSTFTRTLPGAPDGEYVVIQFDSQFENKAAAIETVTPMRDKDGAWKVSGYFIK